MTTTLVLVTSLVLQLTAAGLAFRLIRITGRRYAWILVASAILLMAVRRTVSLHRILAGDMMHPPDLSAELVALSISILLVAGIWLIGPMFQSIRLSEQMLRNQADRLNAQRAALVGLAKREAVAGGDWDAAVKEITEAAARTLAVERSSVWMYNEDRSTIRCVDLYKNGPDTHASGAELEAKAYPAYFKALEEDRALAADNACRDPRTQEFTDTYLRPLGITSMLDAPIRMGGRVAGVFCSEHIGSGRRWTFDEQVFAGSIADMVTLAMEAWERRQVEEELARYRNQLEELVRKRTTELEASYGQLRVSERLASIGTLAAGVAHEINNPVCAILLSAQVGLRTLGHPGQGHNAEELYRNIIVSAERCRKIVKSLLQFARRERAEKWEDDLNLVVQRAFTLTRGYAEHRGAAVHLDLANDLPKVVFSPIEIEQVLVNLIKNALEAGDEGLQVTIRTEYTSGGVRITVRDNGRGMTEDERRHLFDPFYTTRQDEGGMGLGLSTSHGIIADHKGAIRVESRPGEGTTFVVELPANGSSSKERV
jgi:two-component system, NtrC family, sensor kinase